jgi:hypothetical protein
LSASPVRTRVGMSHEGAASPALMRDPNARMSARFTVSCRAKPAVDEVRYGYLEPAQGGRHRVGIYGAVSRHRIWLLASSLSQQPKTTCNVCR